MKTTSTYGEKKAAKDFIHDTRNGKYTKEKIDLKYYVTYKRLEIQEMDASNAFNDDIILYGISV
jgi:hypothetical protein